MRGRFKYLMLALLTCGQVYAADLPAPVVETVEDPAQPGEPRWSFATAPYLWAAGISGDIAQFGRPTVSVDASFSDIFDNLDFGAMFVNELRYDRFGLFTDFIYVKISGSKGTPLGLLADSVSVDTQTLIFTAAGEFRIIEQPDATLDVIAGARVLSVDTDISLAGGPLGGITGSDGDTWVERWPVLRAASLLAESVEKTGPVDV